MAEEHRCQAPRLCANNCGFFGSPGTQDLCSKCHRDLQLKEQQSSSAKLVLSQTLAPPQTSSPAVSSTVEPLTAPPSSSSSSSSSVDDAPPSASTTDEKIGSAVTPNRCSNCRKRVGLTGFKCRCGLTLCGSHRYPEKHGCGFDFKAMGRDQIAKENPVVKGEKLQKI